MIHNETKLLKFEKKVNTRWNKIKSEIKLLDLKEVNPQCIKSRKSFKKICFAALIEQYNDDISNTEEIMNDIYQFYEGGKNIFEKEHSDFLDDLELFYFEYKNDSGKTALNLPYNNNFTQLIPKSEQIKKKIRESIITLFPPLTWMPIYFKNWKKNMVSDFIAGLTIGVMVK